MLKFLTNLLSRKRKRQIFEYFDGAQTRYADPIVAMAVLEHHDEYRADLHPKLAEGGDYDAIRILGDAICDAFDVKRLDPTTGRGLSTIELCELHGTFFTYLEETVKKNTGTFATTPNSGVESTLPPSAETITNSTAPSTSIVSAPPFGAPISSGKP